MKKYVLLLALGLLTPTGIIHAQPVIITGFGTAQVNPFDPATDFTTPWTGSTDTTTLTVTNVSTSSGGITDVLPNPIDIGTSTAYLNLTGALTQAPTSNNFYITLYDTTNADTLTYNLQWNSFTSATITISAALSGTVGAFNGTVAAWDLTVAGAPGDTVSFAFNNLSSSSTPVPEPSPYFLTDLALISIVWLFQRRRALNRFLPTPKT
jgi:hypothetical protein